jgi:hypothetical protein
MCNDDRTIKIYQTNFKKNLVGVKQGLYTWGTRGARGGIKNVKWQVSIWGLRTASLKKISKEKSYLLYKFEEGQNT